MVRDEDVPRFARLGVIASMQPVFVGEYARFAEARVGKGAAPLGLSDTGLARGGRSWWRAARIIRRPWTPGTQS